MGLFIFMSFGQNILVLLLHTGTGLIIAARSDGNAMMPRQPRHCHVSTLLYSGTLSWQGSNETRVLVDQKHGKPQSVLGVSLRHVR